MNPWEQDPVPVPAEASPVPAQSEPEGRFEPFVFTGTASEYFKIWIVNITLTLLTLGIYSAWAKVRTKRYFYGNTSLQGASFEYLADPLKILRGRLIAAAVIGLYYVTTLYFPPAEFAFIAAFLIALPWLVVKAMNLRRPQHR